MIKKVLIIILLCSIILTPVNAETTYTIEKSEYVEPSINTWEDEDGDLHGYGGASKLTLKDSSGKQVTAYCTDPYAPAATGSGVTYVKADINVQDKAAYESIYKAACGDEKKAVTGTKTYITNYGQETMGYNSKAASAYSGVLDGTSSYSGNRDELLTMVNDARKAADAAGKKSEEGKTEEGEKKTTSEGITTSATKNSVTISGAAGSYQVPSGSGYNCVTTTSGTKTITKCTLDKSFCESNPDAIVDVPINDTSSLPETPGDAGDAGSPGGSGGEEPVDTCECEAEMYVVSSGYDGSPSQRFIACTPKYTSGGGGTGDGSGGNGSGEGTGEEGGSEGGSNGSGGSIVDPIALECDSFEEEEDACNVPCDSFTDYIDESNGSEYCDATGSVVVEVEEYTYADTYEDTYCCLKKEPDPKKKGILATKTLLGNVSLCQAYCTDKHYYLELPGPTSKSYDSEVMVNAGTFFNITGEMKSVSNIECYVSADYSQLVNAINDKRRQLADAVTAMNKAKATQSASYTTIEHEHEITEWVTKIQCPEDYPDLTQDKRWCYTLDGSSYIKAEKIKEKEVIGYEYSYEGKYKVPGYTKVYLDGWDEDDGGSYKTVPVNGYTAYCDISSPGEVCDEYTESTTVEGIAGIQKTIDDLQKDLDPNADGYLKALLKEWDYCLTGWNFNQFNTNVKRPENKCYTQLNFTYEDGEANGWFPIINATVETSGTAPLTNGSASTKNLKIGSCDDSGNCSESTTTVPFSNEFTYGTNTITTTYTFDNRFCSPHDENQPVYYLAGADESTCNGIVMEGFPVSMNTPQGEYSYRFDYRGIGYYYDNAPACVGRLESIIDVDDSSYDNTCLYNVNNCRNCHVGCVDKGGGCNIDFGKTCNSRCQSTCVGGGCIFDYGKGFLATYRTISLNNPFPNGVAYLNNTPSLLLAYAPSSTRSFAVSNWNTDKGDFAIEEIAGKGENIYDSAPDYAITLTPGTIQAIKDYNAANPDYFSKSTLQCSVSSSNYSTCTSTFIDSYGFDAVDRNWRVYPEAWEDIPFTGPALQ